MKLIKFEEPIGIPPELAICPKCEGKLTVADISGWTQDDDGSWIADEISLECEHEPDIDSDEWDEWFNWHFNMPYVDWLPIDELVKDWLKANYRFEL